MGTFSGCVCAGVYVAVLSHLFGPIASTPMHPPINNQMLPPGNLHPSANGHSPGYLHPPANSQPSAYHQPPPNSQPPDSAHPRSVVQPTHNQPPSKVEPPTNRQLTTNSQPPASGKSTKEQPSSIAVRSSPDLMMMRMPDMMMQRPDMMMRTPDMMMRMPDMMMRSPDLMMRTPEMMMLIPDPAMRRYWGYFEQRLRYMDYEVNLIRQKLDRVSDPSMLGHMDAERFRLYQLREELDRFKGAGAMERMMSIMWFMENKIDDVNNRMNGYLMRLMDDLMRELRALRNEVRTSDEAQRLLDLMMSNLQRLRRDVELARTYEAVYRTRLLFTALMQEFEQVRAMPRVGMFSGMLSKMSNLFRRLRDMMM